MRPIPIVLAALFVVACGPTAQVITSPTPDGSGSPTNVPSNLPTGPTATTVGSSTPIPLSSATPIGLNTPTPPGETPGPAGGPFARLDSFPASDAFEVTDVAVTPGGYVAVGFGGQNGGDYYGPRQGIVWNSIDGVNWTESVDPNLLNVTPFKVVSKGSDLYLAGDLTTCSDFDENCTDVPQAGNGIWHSSNGGPWQLLPQQADLQHGFIDNMFLAGDRLVVYGGAGDDETTTVWLSTDGITWTSTTDLAGMDPVTSMAAGPSGLSAFGTIYDDAAFDVVLVAATSSDGMHFTPAHAPQMDGSGIDDLAVGPQGLAGVGYHTTELFDNSGVAVHSADGLTWTQATNSDGSFAGAAMSRVHALVGGGYVALGDTPQGGDSVLTDGDAWFSADGSDWALIAHLDGSFSVFSCSELGATGVIVFAAEQVDLPNGDTGSIVHAWFAPLASIHG